MREGEFNDATCSKVKSSSDPTDIYGLMAVCKRKHVAATTITKTTITVTTVTTSTSTTTEGGPEGRGWYCKKYGPTRRCCYKYYNRVVKKVLTDNVRRTWTDAQEQCEKDEHYSDSMDVNLASVSGEVENSFISELLYTEKYYNDFTNRPVWVGGNRPTSAGTDWQWSDKQTPWNYENWREGEPSDYAAHRPAPGTETEDCLQMTQPDVSALEKGNKDGRMGKDKQGININPTDRGHWNAAMCSKKRGYVCEFCYDPTLGDPTAN
jgi:hypothetical protein